MLTPLALLGGWLFWRQRVGSVSDGTAKPVAYASGSLRQLLTLLAGPVALGWLAGLVHAYPYTGARVMVYALPCLALLIGAAIPPAWAWVVEVEQRLCEALGEPRRTQWLAPLLVLPLLLAPLALTMYRVVDCWGRPDWDNATIYVLRHYQPGDVVAGNAWELEYYFRSLGPAYQQLQAKPEGPRVWLVLIGPTEEERRKTLDLVLDSDTEVLDQQTFAEAGVYCLGQPGAVAQQSP
jgi:hypothetical protein